MMEFTKEHETLLITHNQEYVQFVVNNAACCPDELTVEDVRDDIGYLYRKVGLEPPKFIFFSSSYLQENLIANFILFGGLERMVNLKLGMYTAYTTQTHLNYGRDININKININKMYDNSAIHNLKSQISIDMSSVADDFDNKVMPIIKQECLKDMKKIKGPGLKTYTADGGVAHLDVWLDIAHSLLEQIKTQNCKGYFNPIITLEKPITGNIQSQCYKDIGVAEADIWNNVYTSIGISNQARNQLDRQIQSVMPLVDKKNIKDIIKNSVEKNPLLKADDLIAYSSVISFLKGLDQRSSLMSLGQNFGSSFDAWGVVYSFFKKIGLLNNEYFDRYLSLMQKGIWSGQFFRDWCVITQMPLHIYRDRQLRLHSLDGPCVDWRRRKTNKDSRLYLEDMDGRNYCIHGVPFSKSMWSKVVTNTISIKEILEIKNMEQRQVVLAAISPKRFIDECGGTLISTHKQAKQGSKYMNQLAYSKIQHQDIELYLIKDVSKLGLSNPIYILFYTDPSTTREYFMFVHPRNALDAATAMASSLGISKQGYLNITAES